MTQLGVGFRLRGPRDTSTRIEAAGRHGIAGGFPRCHPRCRHLPFSCPTWHRPSSPRPRWKLTFKLLERLAKGYTWVGGILVLVGLACGWRIFLRPEHLTLFCMGLLLLVISWIRYWIAGLDFRYFMPMVIVGTPWMALGLECVIAGARRLAQRRGELSPRALRDLTGSLIATSPSVQLLDGTMPAAAHMRKSAALGRWIRKHVEPRPAMAGNVDYLDLGHLLRQWPRGRHLLAPRLHDLSAAGRDCRAKGRCRSCSGTGRASRTNS